MAIPIPPKERIKEQRAAFIEFTSYADSIRQPLVISIMPTKKLVPISFGRLTNTLFMRLPKKPTIPTFKSISANILNNAIKPPTTRIEFIEV